LGLDLRKKSDMEVEETKVATEQARPIWVSDLLTRYVKRYSKHAAVSASHKYARADYANRNSCEYTRGGRYILSLCFGHR
jgi:hypothetical protein